MDNFTLQYIETLLWSSGEEYDDYSIADIDADSMQEIEQDCKSFLDEYIQVENIPDWYDLEQAAHDFCLTRNGHGAGFWDRGLGKLGQELTDKCKPYGNQEIYIGDDNKIHVF